MCSPPETDSDLPHAVEVPVLCFAVGHKHSTARPDFCWRLCALFTLVSRRHCPRYPSREPLGGGGAILPAGAVQRNGGLVYVGDGAASTVNVAGSELANILAQVPAGRRHSALLRTQRTRTVCAHACVGHCTFAALE